MNKPNTATLWNRLCARSPHLTLTPVSVPNHRKPSTRVSWSELPESFQADVERHLAWASGSDLFAADTRVRALAPRTQRLRREQIQTAVTALVNSGWKRQHLTCLADLVQVDAFKAIMRHRHDAAGRKSSAYNIGLATTLIGVAQEWVKSTPEEIKELKRLRSRLPKLPPDLLDKHKELLRACDSELLAKLMQLPERLLKAALSKPLSFRALADAQAALAIAIPLYAPLRATNLAGLTFGTSIFLPKRESQETQIYIAPEQAKTNEPYLTVLPPKLTALIKTYVERILVPYTGRAAHFLFDNGAGRQKGAATISWLIQRTLKRHLGLRMTEHQFRHLTAKVLRDGGADYETVHGNQSAG